MKQEGIIKIIRQYYTDKIKEFGPVPQGADWNGEKSQVMRFDQLMKLIGESNTDFSLLDYGCGYGALFDYLNQRNVEVSYTGYDISTEMIKTARNIHPSSIAQWTSRPDELLQYDYLVASGIFNVREQTPDVDWEQYMYETISHMDKLSIKGFAFNALTEYSDPDKMKQNLFYANPGRVFNYCKTTISKSVAILHDYALYEFTVLVRKNIL